MHQGTTNLSGLGFGNSAMNLKHESLHLDAFATEHISF